MASTASPPYPASLFVVGYPTWKNQTSILLQNKATMRNNNHAKLCVFAATQDSGNWQRPPPGVDTRIHWENDDEGWVGGTSSNAKQEPLKPETEQKNLLGEKFSELLYSSDSHYQFLGIPPDADLEEIKTAYRRLSKEYHPDTTSLPLKTASEKFMRLREIYNVLSDDESRRFYDWTLAQEAASRRAEKMRMKLEDPYEQDVMNYEPVPDMVDRLGGKNLELSDQAMSALTFDAIILVFSICCIVYAIFFKEY
ncbi:NAD(P)H-quinone oxidoreductase subunit T, chloroplastic-like [Chenopodium quinoa]|uniref:J domain-containing protein n=1 Tax=Chenopodium quinoa TaxID=63459 RepID=A0A803M3A7_CHEQI|nr:NAD(P)H-quinone oxidoreductase subunit T, chloroplastic-like [Chenopodium quinoa]